jgi:hypothetical protein
VLGIVEAKKLALFLGNKLGENEIAVVKSDSDVEMLACNGTAEGDRWLQECVHNSGELAARPGLILG